MIRTQKNAIPSTSASPNRSLEARNSQPALAMDEELSIQPLQGEEMSTQSPPDEEMSSQLDSDDDTDFGSSTQIITPNPPSSPSVIATIYFDREGNEITYVYINKNN